jgi:putative ABC transport system permease protein
MSKNQKDHPQPPAWADKLLSWRLEETAAEEVIGDMHELYIEWVNRLGMNRAKALYWFNAAGFLQPLPNGLSEKKTNYTTAEELLASDGFIKWYQQTDERSVRAWDKWIAKHPEHQRLANEAVQVLQLLREAQENKIAEQEITAATNRLTDTILNKRKSRYQPSKMPQYRTNSPAMIKNYLKIASRNLAKNKISSFINIGGLAVGMAVAMLIGLWIYDELSYNKYHKNYNRIVKVLRQETWKGETSTSPYNPLPVSGELRSSFADNFKHVTTSTFTDEHTLIYGDKKFNRLGNYMETEGPEILDLEMLQGTWNGLADINSIFISETTAKLLFGETDPINKTIKIDNRADVKVTGLYKDLPFNSEFKDVTFIASFDLYLSLSPWLRKDDWNNNYVQVLAEISPNTSPESISRKISDIKTNNVKKEAVSSVTKFLLHPMSKWHLYEEFKQGINVGGRIQYLWLFGIVGVFVLLLACINFMNLSTARSEKRAKEVGIRKAVGSVRGQLINQFLSESLLVASLAFIFSLAFVQLTLPWFNSVADKQMRILWAEPRFWIAGLGFTFITGLIAGSYPAFYLSSFNPVKTLKGSFRAGRLAVVPRKILVVLQFTVSVALIIGTIIVYRQIQFTRDRSVGYSSDKLIYLKMKTNDVHEHYEAVRNDFLATGAVSDMAESYGFVIQNSANSGGFEWKGKDPNFLDNFALEWVSHDYGKTVGWQFIAGRDFSKTAPSDSFAYVINEAAAKYMSLKNPVGELLRKDGKNYKIIGVIKDVIAESPYKPVRPTLTTIVQWPGSILSIKLNPRLAINEALAKIEPVFRKHVSGAPFDYKFVDEEYGKKFGAELRIGKLSGFFAFLAIFISCLGLFALASFVAEQRRKEIGIRKVLGASGISLWRMLSKDFVILVVISCLIAIPVAYYFLHNWLQNYQYRTEISWWIFAIVAVGAMLITLLTVSFQAIKAAVVNPVNSLRTE